MLYSPIRRVNRIDPRFIALLALFFLLPACAYCQIAGCTDCHLPDIHDPLEKAVADAAYTLDSAYQFRVPVYITNSETEMVGDNGIAITKDLIRKLDGQKPGIQQLVLWITLAHERGHIIQHRKLPAEFRDDETRKLLLECHADMIAGAFMGHRFIDLYADRLDHFATLVDTANISIAKVRQAYQQEMNYFTDALEIFVQLSDVYEHAEHPLSMQRLMAAKIGFTMGCFEQFGRLIPFYRLLLQGLPGTDQQKLDEFRYFTLQGIDFRNTDNELNWGLRQSARIIHPNPIPRRYLQVEQQDISFDTNSAHPMVYYELTLRNTAPFSIQCDFAADCTMANRNDPERLQLSSNATNKNYAITLAPGRTYHIRDSLMWFANAEMEPYLRILPDPVSLYVVDFISADDAQRYGKQFVENSNIQPSDIKTRLIYILGWISRDNSNHMETIKAGPVLLGDDSTRTFPCFSPESGVTARLSPNAKTSVTMDFYDGPEVDAGEMFNKAMQTIKDYFGDSISNVSTGQETNGKRSDYVYIRNKETGKHSFIKLVIVKKGARSKVTILDYL